MSTVADATSDINANPPWVETHGYIQPSLRDKETRLRRHPILTHSVTALTAVTPVMGIDLVPGVTGSEREKPPWRAARLGLAYRSPDEAVWWWWEAYASEFGFARRLVFSQAVAAVTL